MRGYSFLNLKNQNCLISIAIGCMVLFLLTVTFIIYFSDFTGLEKYCICDEKLGVKVALFCTFVYK